MKPKVGVSWMPDPRFRAAVEPALHLVEAVEHTVDHAFDGPLPPSALHVLAAFGPLGRAHGHGVEASPFSAGRDDCFDAWVDALARTARSTLADHTDHYGFCTGGPFRAGAPLPTPECLEGVEQAAARLGRIREVLGVEVGLENLALAFSRRQALAQGSFVEAVLARVDGFVHLDLHNLWCQVRNFGLDAEALLATWPLDRVRRVHVSGGSDREGVRRDTHDHGVPEEVWALLAGVLPRLAGCRAVILEQMPFALETEAQQAAFRLDLERLRAVRDASGPRPGPAARATPTEPPRLGTRAELGAFQAALLRCLDDHDRGEAARDALLADPAARPYRAWAEDLEPRMLRVGHELVHRWGVRDVAPQTSGS